MNLKTNHPLVPIAIIIAFFLSTGSLFSQVTIFSEDFESASEGELSTIVFNGWKQYTITATSSDWGITNNCPITGTYSASLRDGSNIWCDYTWNNNGNEVAYYATPINATAHNTVTLSFNWRCYAEPGFDYGRICYSTNGGTTWIDFSNSGTYNGQVSTQTVTNLDISDVDGLSFLLGFRFYNDGATGAVPGFTVDDIVVQAIQNCPTVAGTASASSTVLCGASSTLSLTGEDPSATIQWQVSTDGGATWSNIVGATTDPYVVSPGVDSQYRALVTNGCTTASNSVSITVSCTIIHPVGNLTSSNLTVNCGSTYTYYDHAQTSNYSNNQNSIITICPSTAGQYVTLTLNSFNLENNFDFLYVFDGNDGTAPLIGVYTGNIGAGPTVTASSANTSGCLSFRFISDPATVAAGWDFAVSCTGTPATPYPASGIEDCNGAATICSDATLVGGTTGYGGQELPVNDFANCLFEPGEAESNWYVFSSSTNGTIAFDIEPADGTTDYDWAIWGPYNSLQCPTFTGDHSIRCNASANYNSGPNSSTGLSTSSNDTIEENGNHAGETTDGYCEALDVLAGEIYIMMLDNWDASTVDFELTWNLTNGASLDCTPLPINLASFESKCDNNQTSLEWATESEVNNNFFIVEKSGADFLFEEIGKVFGAGNSSSQIEYSFIDTEINEETAYYRLVQVDFDGSVEYHRIISSNCHDYSFNVVKNNLLASNLDLLITSGANELLTISLYSSTGKLITKDVKEVNAGNNSLSLRNFNISSGIYLLSIQGEYHSYSTKLIRK